MSMINKEVADFSVQAFQNNAFHTVSKKDILGKWSIFFFYPADFTFVCPTELEDLQNLYEKFKKAGAEVFSVSTDTHFTHKAWHDHSDRIKNITYPMLADPIHVLSRAFDVLIEEGDGAGLAERGTFIVDPDGRIQAYEVNAGNVGRNADELLRKLEACQFVREHGDQVCPAKWQPGAETLKPSLDLIGAL
ncbi:alkyl hydroperoxide reductase subunit C [Selenomonas sp. TAMA-11512]|uniref:alkyl hydroperoxide reductase subunit C n=1 Tax=Selenomonas sp. TAMA-11512 TaxID=3095337 RepID=UPI00308E1CC0|nr:alkyl hydroperoxide reductase subunit C [Selenomonas sp. TAMA-11512]